MRASTTIATAVVGCLALGTPASLAYAGSPATQLPVAPTTVATADASGALRLRVVGLPSGSAAIRVKGPGYRSTTQVRGKLRIGRLQPGTYVVRPKPVAVDGVTYHPVQRAWTVRVSTGRPARLAVTYRAGTTQPTQPTQPTGPTVAPAVPAPPGLIADVLSRINAARASGLRCDGSTGPPLPPIGYSAQLGDLARWHADDFVAGRDNDFLADLTRSGFTGAFVAETAVICPKVADADGVVAAMRDWDASCGHLFDPAVDRIGIAYADGGGVTNAWVLAFGRSSS